MKLRRWLLAALAGVNHRKRNTLVPNETTVRRQANRRSWSLDKHTRIIFNLELIWIFIYYQTLYLGRIFVSVRWYLSSLRFFGRFSFITHNLDEVSGNILCGIGWDVLPALAVICFWEMNACGECECMFWSVDLNSATDIDLTGQRYRSIALFLSPNFYCSAFLRRVCFGFLFSPLFMGSLFDGNVWIVYILSVCRAHFTLALNATNKQTL